MCPKRPGIAVYTSLAHSSPSPWGCQGWTCDSGLVDWQQETACNTKRTIKNHRVYMYGMYGVFIYINGPVDFYGKKLSVNIPFVPWILWGRWTSLVFGGHCLKQTQTRHYFQGNLSKLSLIFFPAGLDHHSQKVTTSCGPLWSLYMELWGVLKMAENKWVTEVIILIGVIIPLIRWQKGHIESPWNLFFQQTWITK